MCLQGVSGMDKERISCWNSRRECHGTVIPKVERFSESKIVKRIPKESQALGSSAVCWDPHLSTSIFITLTTNISGSERAKRSCKWQGQVCTFPSNSTSFSWGCFPVQWLLWSWQSDAPQLTPQWRMAISSDQEALWRAERYIFASASGWSGSERRFQRDRYHRPEDQAKTWRADSLCTSFHAFPSKILVFVWPLDTFWQLQ